MSHQPFEFKNTLKFNENEYVRIYTTPVKISSPLKFAAGCIAAFALLFWPYTLIIGLGFFGIFGLNWLASRFLRPGLTKIFKANRFIRQKTNYSADDHGFIVETHGYRASISWDKAMAWTIANGWLRIETRGFPNCLFRVSDLKNSGVYDPIITKLREHSTERPSLNWLLA